MYDVTALGELLIDLTHSGTSSQGNPILEANPGGAPCNVLAMLAKLGRETAFIGKVGRDGFGQQLCNALDEVGIHRRGLCWDPKVPTTLACVHTLPGGDRDFSFYREPGADVMLEPEEVDEALIRDSRLFHFGTLSLTGEPVRSATHRAVALAEEAGLIRSFDPNLRPPLWESLDHARQQTLWGLGHCDILKIADNELRWLTGLEELEEGVAWIQSRFPGIRLVLLTLGADGSRAYQGSLRVHVPGFAAQVVDTTGAGDTFFGAALHHVLSWGLREYRQKELEQMLRFANAAASLITRRPGALRVMPSQEQIRQLLAGQREEIKKCDPNG